MYMHMHTHCHECRYDYATYSLDIPDFLSICFQLLPHLAAVPHVREEWLVRCLGLRDIQLERERERELKFYRGAQKSLGTELISPLSFKIFITGNQFE